MKIISISDTHTMHGRVDVPDGDILIHSGDATFHGYEKEVREFGEWFRNQPHKYKIFVAGNHDTSFEDTPIQARQWFFDTKTTDPTKLCTRNGVIYLQEQSVTLTVDGEDVVIYGAPHQPWFHNWAFNVKTTGELKAIWDKIPKGTDILVTHGPPYGIRDLSSMNVKCGCRELKKAIGKIRPKLHICGHIHEGYGVEQWAGTLIANSSVCNVSYDPVNDPLIFEFKNGKMQQTSKV